MFQLYKDRGFGDYISDTIDFFKKFGKHYFKNYLILNGMFLMVLVVLFYFVSKVYSDFLQSSIVAGSQNPNIMTEYFSNNSALFFCTIFLFVILIIIISLISYAFPSLYLELYEKNNDTNFTTKDIINSLKQNIGKIVIFFLGTTFIIMPILFLVMVVNVLLCFIIIGFPLFFITFPAMMAWVSLSFNNYIIGKDGYFESLGNGFKMLKNNFWNIVGATLVMFIILYILQMIITMIPYMMGIASLFSSGQNFQDPSQSSNVMGTFSIMMSFVFILSILFSFVTNNLQFVQHILMYYSMREQSEQNSSHSEIDLIGSESE